MGKVHESVHGHAAKALNFDSRKWLEILVFKCTNEKFNIIVMELDPKTVQ